MKSEQLSTIKISFVAVLAVVSFTAYDFFFMQHVGAADATSDQATTTPGLTDEQTAILDKLDALKLDTSVFSNPVFQHLTSNAVTLTSEPAGKPNPFAPLSGTSATTQPAPKSTKTTKSTTSR